MEVKMGNSFFSSSRRFFLGALVCLAMAVVLPVNAFSAETKKPLVVYYSYSGNTAKLAKEIHDRVGGDLVEIKTSFAYPEQYETMVEVAKKQLQDGFRPPLDMRMPNISDYDVIYLGFPNWWSTMAAPVYTFVEQAKLDGKTILPFLTHGGGGAGHTIQDLKKLVPQAKVQDALVVSGSRAGSSGEAVDKWLGGMGIK